MDPARTLIATPQTDAWASPLRVHVVFANLHAVAASRFSLAVSMITNGWFEDAWRLSRHGHV